MGYCVSGLNPRSPRGACLPAARDLDAWLRILDLLHAAGRDFLPKNMWQDLAYGNKARVADDAACLLADQLDLLLGQFNQQVPEELRGRLPGWLDTADYIVQDLIPFLRYCGGFEVT